MPHSPTFAVDVRGLARLIERRGKPYALFELIQNAWDEPITQVDVLLVPLGRNIYRLTVEDDAPDGFSDLAHAYTLFAESSKVRNPAKRGRWNLGEKLVIALCTEATIESTSGTVVFDHRGRTLHRRRRRRAGTMFTGVLPLTAAEYDTATTLMRRLLPPSTCTTVFNGERLTARTPIRTMHAALPTEVADVEGRMRPTIRTTEIGYYSLAAPDDTPLLYEMGLPVVEIPLPWHVNVAQKVPLNVERDNVTPAYLRALCREAANHLHDLLDQDTSTGVWAETALSDPAIQPDAVDALLTQRFGARRVIFDPSDQEANKLAMAGGYTVIPPRAFSKPQWTRIRESNAALPAGQVTPSPRPFHPNGQPLQTVPPDAWTADDAARVDYVKAVARVLLGHDVQVTVAEDPDWQFAAAFGQRHLTIQRRILRGPVVSLDDILIHELAHDHSEDHFSHQYLTAVTSLGSKFVQAVRAGTAPLPPGDAAGACRR